MTEAQKRMRDIVIRMQDYLFTYDKQASYMDYSDTIFIDDMLYGIGIAIEPEKHRFGSGFDAFKAVLRERVQARAEMEASVTRTVWTKNSDSDPYCVHCRKTWDMHLCDGFSSCPTANRGV